MGWNGITVTRKYVCVERLSCHNCSPRDACSHSVSKKRNKNIHIFYTKSFKVHLWKPSVFVLSKCLGKHSFNLSKKRSGFIHRNFVFLHPHLAHGRHSFNLRKMRLRRIELWRWKFNSGLILPIIDWEKKKKIQVMAMERYPLPRAA